MRLSCVFLPLTTRRTTCTSRHSEIKKKITSCNTPQISNKLRKKSLIHYENFLVTCKTKARFLYEGFEQIYANTRVKSVNEAEGLRPV